MVKAQSIQEIFVEDLLQSRQGAGSATRNKNLPIPAFILEDHQVASSPTTVDCLDSSLAVGYWDTLSTMGPGGQISYRPMSLRNQNIKARRL